MFKNIYFNQQRLVQAMDKTPLVPTGSPLRSTAGGMRANPNSSTASPGRRWRWSPVPGTTTDPVKKAMEFHPLGPVLFIDTAGLDDEGELGRRRVEKTRQVIEGTDFAVYVMDINDPGRRSTGG